MHLHIDATIHGKPFARALIFDFRVRALLSCAKRKQLL